MCPWRCWRERSNESAQHERVSDCDFRPLDAWMAQLCSTVPKLLEGRPCWSVGARETTRHWLRSQCSVLDRHWRSISTGSVGGPICRPPRRTLSRDIPNRYWPRSDRLLYRMLSLGLKEAARLSTAKAARLEGLGPSPERRHCDGFQVGIDPVHDAEAVSCSKVGRIPRAFITLTASRCGRSSIGL